MITWDQLRYYLERDGIPFAEEDGRLKVLAADFPLSGVTLQLRVLYDADNGVVSFVVPNLPLPRRLPRTRHELRRTLLALNSCYILGGFNENAQGRIAFQISLPIEGNELPYSVYRRLLVAALGSVERALPWLRQVAMGAMSAEEAVESIAEVSQRLADVQADHAMTAPVDEGGGSESITESEIEEFGRSLLDDHIPPPMV
jgi:hypothetical protein